MKPPSQPDIEAEVTFLGTAEGGRSTPFLSGYYPNHLVLPNYLTSGRHYYKDKDRVLPGESAITEIWFLSPDQYPHSMQVGTVIPVQEGSRLVGHAKVLKIYNKVLETVNDSGAGAVPRIVKPRRSITKNPTIAFLLNFLLPGAGLAYLGKWKWGFINLGIVLLIGGAAEFLLPDETLRQYGHNLAVLCGMSCGVSAYMLAKVLNGEIEI
jgi:hypothetical protein